MMASVFPASSKVAVQALQRELSFFAGCGYAPFAWLTNPGTYQDVHSCSRADGAKFGMMQRYSSQVRAARGVFVRGAPLLARAAPTRRPHCLLTFSHDPSAKRTAKCTAGLLQL